jgi:hypothetical protein
MPEPALYRWAVSPPKPLRREAFIPLGYRIYPGRTDETERAFEGDTVTETLDPFPTNPLDPRNGDVFKLGSVPTGNGTEVRELDPVCCHHGHPLNPGTCTRGWQPCGCGGHRTWRCWHTLDNQLDGQLCGDVVLWPPRGEQCTPVGGYGTGSNPTRQEGM